MMLTEINEYLRRTKMAETAFGRLVANDPRLVRDIRNGREPRSAMKALIRALIAGEG